MRRFAVEGYDAIAVNLHWRDAPGADPDDDAASRANGGVPDDRFVGDAAGAVRRLQERPTSNGRVATIGFCSGGRQAVLSAAQATPSSPSTGPLFEEISRCSTGGSTGWLCLKIAAAGARAARMRPSHRYR